MSGNLKDKTMNNKLIYISNYGKQNNLNSRLLVEKFGHWKFETNQSSFNKSNQNFSFVSLGTSIVYSPMSPPSLVSQFSTIQNVHLVYLTLSFDTFLKGII